MNLLEYMERHGHEHFSACTNLDAGLRAFIAVHNTTLGPALGGVRIWPHPSEDAAMMDVLRLSRAMTYKSAAAGLNFGGGKGLIIADPSTDKTKALMGAFGRFVDTLGGRYITTEDVGMTPQDVTWIAEETSHVTGLPLSEGGSGDPSGMTGFGVYQGMRACAKAVWGTESMAGRVVAIQGFGHTATALAHELLNNEEGITLLVSDINKSAISRAKEHKRIQVIDSQDIYSVPCDIFAPCALGGILNNETIPQLKCRIVCGSANNQLLDEEHGEILEKHDILYAPDYIVNAGGVINISCEVNSNYLEASAKEKTSRIYYTLQEVLKISNRQGITTAQAAEKLAEERISTARREK